MCLYALYNNKNHLVSFKTYNLCILNNHTNIAKYTKKHKFFSFPTSYLYLQDKSMSGKETYRIDPILKI